MATPTPVQVSGFTPSGSIYDLNGQTPQSEAEWEKWLQKLREEVTVAGREDGPNGSTGLQRAQHTLRGAEGARDLWRLERSRAQVAEQPS